MLGDSLEQLREAQNRFIANIQSLTLLKASTVGQEMMIPLTSMAYVPGQLVSNDRVMIDVGTGYYIQKVRLAIKLIVLIPFHIESF